MSESTDVSEMSSMPAWNCKNLPQPAIYYPCYKHFQIDIEVWEKILKLIQKLCVFLRGPCIKDLSSEADLLSKLIYKFKMIFRRDKFFKTILKLNHCLDVFKSIELEKTSNQLVESLSNTWSLIVHPKDDNIFLPSQKMFEHLLLQLCGTANLFKRIISTTESIHLHLKQILNIGHHIATMTLFSSLNSRIWVLSLSILRIVTNIYSGLLQQMKRLKIFTKSLCKDKFPEDFGHLETESMYVKLVGSSICDLKTFDNYSIKELMNFSTQSVKPCKKSYLSSLLEEKEHSKVVENEDINSTFPENESSSITVDQSASEDIGVPIARSTEPPMNSQDSGFDNLDKLKKSIINSKTLLDLMNYLKKLLVVEPNLGAKARKILLSGLEKQPQAELSSIVSDIHTLFQNYGNNLHSPKLPKKNGLNLPNEKPISEHLRSVFSSVKQLKQFKTDLESFAGLLVYKNRSKRLSDKKMKKACLLIKSIIRLTLQLKKTPEQIDSTQLSLTKKQVNLCLLLENLF